MRSFRPYFSLGKCFLALAGSAILAFGLYNVHSFSNVTEGGVLGMTLLLVEQNAHHALKLANRAYVLVNGEIRLSGSGAELLDNPEVRNAYLGMS